MANQEYLLSPTRLEGENFVGRRGYPFDLFAYVLGQLPWIGEERTKADTSWEIDRYWLQRRDPEALEALSCLSNLLLLAATTYPDLNKKGEVKLGKQQPSFNEAITGTLKRLQFLLQLTTHLQSTALSCISGGSMSYGRFYNIRGDDQDPSDLDLILVYEEGDGAGLEAGTILPREIYPNPEDVRLLKERIGKFIDMENEGKVQVLSQKVSTGRGFDASLHIMSSRNFYNFLIGGVVADLKSGREATNRVLFDYKPGPFKHQVMRQRDFFGGIHEFRVDEEALEGGGVTGTEVISSIPIYAIKDGRLIPGVYPNLISPCFESEPSSSTRTRSAVKLYQSLMHELQDRYREKNPSASILKSHIRYEIFSPRLKEEYE